MLVLDGDGRAHSASGEPKPDELARHKLLDLMGDLYLFGGPPVGRIVAERPGHARSHEAMRKALDGGLIAPFRRRN